MWSGADGLFRHFGQIYRRIKIKVILMDNILTVQTIFYKEPGQEWEEPASHK